MDFLTGEYRNTLDEKGRILFPTKLRNQLFCDCQKSVLMVTKSFDPCLWLYTLDEWKKYEPYHRGRMSVRPGITGMWQVNGRSDVMDFEKVVELDRRYISEWTVGLDIKIILKTIIMVIKGKGAK